MKTCDICSKESKKVIAGRWVFYCSDNEKCKAVEVKKIHDNELVPALNSGEMPDYEVLENFI